MLVSKTELSLKLGFKKRTLDYYVRMGFLRKPVRLIGVKEVFWDDSDVEKTLDRIQKHYNIGGKLKYLAKEKE